MGIRGQQPIFSPKELLDQFNLMKQQTNKTSINFAHKWLRIDRKTLYNYKRNTGYDQAFKSLTNQI